MTRHIGVISALTAWHVPSNVKVDVQIV